MHRKRIVVGLSGGVDSAVTACLLKKQDHELIGVFMRNWHDDESHCTNAIDEQDARKVCVDLNIPFHTVDFSKNYMDKVFVSMLADLQRGYTPNPDILCNQEIKFKVLLDYAMTHDADYLATGHYAQIKALNGEPALAEAADANKDQTYFLSRLPRSALSKILFPIGAYKKPEIRRLAQSFSLDNAAKKDSTGICFVGERRFRDFISEHLLDKPGNIIDDSGSVIGQHRGLFYYTIGQRKGLAIGGRSEADELPWFVLAKDMQHNQLIVGQGDQHPALYKQSLIAKHVHWLTQPMKSNSPIQAYARIRHRQSLQHATVRIDDDRLDAQFVQPQRAITPGQSIAVYQDHFCIASAIIEASTE